MKKLLVFLFSVTVVFGAFAQAGTKGIAATASYGTEISNIGVGGRLQYNYTDAARFELGADYFLKNDYTTMWDLNLNLDYMFSVAPKVKIYPLIGVTYTNWKFDYDGLTDDLGDWFDDFDLGQYNTEGKTKHVSRVGANVGAGGEYFLNENFAISFELKYQFLKDFNQTVFGIGAVYKFK